MSQFGRHISAWDRARGVRIALGLVTAIGMSSTATAGTFDFWGIDGSYKATLGYAGAMRMEDPDPALITDEVDPFRTVNPNPPTNPYPGFTNSGLPKSINYDDGNRNFEKGDLVNNRMSIFTELQLRRKNYGFVISGDAFRDESYLDPNANNTPEGNERRVNKTENPVNKFTDDAVEFSGQRARLLEAYVTGDWGLFDDSMFLNVRVGEHVVAWGESLFNSGLMLAMGHADATRAFVPGAEIKEILLPHNQISATLALTPELSLMSYYKFEFDPTEIFPVGHFFSPTDVVGPGAEFVYGSQNPAFADGCVGLFPPPFDAVCSPPGLPPGSGGPLLNAPPRILVYREADINPDKDGQWGIGGNYQLTPSTGVGLYHIRYHSPNPTVKLNMGFAFVGSTPPAVLGQPPGPNVDVTTEAFNQPVPTSYNVLYYGDIKMTTVSVSTVLGGISYTAELSHRDGIDVQAAAIISGVSSPIFTPGKVNQLLLSSLYVANPKFILDEIAVIGEIAHFRVQDFEHIQGEPGIEPEGNGDVLFTDDKSTGLQMLALGKKRNAFPGWDLLTTFTYGEIYKGNPPITGAFGALFGEGDRRVSLNVGVQYLQNFEVGLGYTWFMGDGEARMHDSYVVPQNPFVDRDYMSLNIKYNL